MTKETNDFDELIDEFGIDLEDSTLDKLLDSILRGYQQYWVFMIGLLITVVPLVREISISTSLGPGLTLARVAILLVSIMAIPFSMMYMFNQDPLKVNKQTIIDYQRAKIDLTRLKQEAETKES